MSPVDSTPETKLSTSRRNRFRVLAILFGILPFLVLEAGLRLAGIQSTTHDPFAEFGGGVPAFVRAGDKYLTNPGREPYLARQSFTVTNPTGTRRVFCFGGSTVHGRPFQPATAFPAWLEIELDHRAPAHDWEVINCGGISYASYRLVPMIREAMAYEPDLIIVATGHNEFLEDRTYTVAKQRGPIRRALDQLRTVRVGRQWLQPQPATHAGEMELKTRLDESSGYASYHRDEEWSRRVEQQFAESLSEIARTCSQAGVPLVFVKLGSNLRDCPPFKSEHRPGMTPAEETAWQSAIEEASRLQASATEGALAAYRHALEIDDQHALLHFRMAKMLDRINSPAAANHYSRARDLDICPLRMTDKLNEALWRATQQHRAPLVDIALHTDSMSNTSMPGFDWYLDHVHPTIRGHQLIAQALADTVASQVAIRIAPEFDDRPQVYAAHLNQLDPRYLGNGRRRLEWLENWARREKLANEITPVTASDHLRLAVRQLDLDDLDGAWSSCEAAIELDSSLAQNFLAKLITNLRQQGRHLTSTQFSRRSETARSALAR